MSKDGLILVLKIIYKKIKQTIFFKLHQTCDGGEENAYENGPGGEGIYYDHVSAWFASQIPLCFILTVGYGISLKKKIHTDYPSKWT